MTKQTLLPGVVLESESLRVRITDNSPRLSHLTDLVDDGYNGVAALIHKEQGKNIFSFAGMNYECASTEPPAGERRELWNAPRVAPMGIERVGERSVRLTQSAAEASGLNAEILFELGDSHLDQTITVWPDHDIARSKTFWASYMNQVQNTSLFLRGRPESDAGPRWLEATSAGHSGDGAVRYRAFDPAGKTWCDHLTDNPLLRQARIQTAESVAATEKAGFKKVALEDFEGFFYGLVDDYVALYIFREGDFSMWMSASGGAAVRNPAWDYQTISGSQKAGERRAFHVRLVYKRFAGVDDVLREVDGFRVG